MTLVVVVVDEAASVVETDTTTDVAIATITAVGHPETMVATMIAATAAADETVTTAMAVALESTDTRAAVAAAVAVAVDEKTATAETDEAGTKAVATTEVTVAAIVATVERLREMTALETTPPVVESTLAAVMTATVDVE